MAEGTAGLAAPTAAGASRTVLAQVIARAVGLLAVVGGTSIVAHRLGAGYAEWGSVTSLVALVGVALEPGLSPVVVRRIAQSPDEAPLPSALVPVRLLLGLLALVVVVGATLALRGSGAVLLAVALGAQVVPRALVMNATPWLQIDQRLHRQSALEAVTAAVGLTALATCSALGAPIWVLGLVGFTLPTALLAVAMQRELRITPSRAHDVPGPQGDRVRSVLREVAPLALALAITASYTRTYVVFLNASDESELARSNFIFAFLFVEQLIVAAGIVSGAVLPLLAARARVASLLRDDVTHRLLAAVCAVGGVLAAVLLALADPLTRLLGGPTQTGAARYVELLSPMALVILPAMVLAYVYVAIGQSRRYLAFTAAGLAVNLAANAVLTLRYGADASGRITWITEALVLLPPLVGVLRTASGRWTAATIAALLAVGAACAELAAADVLPGPVAALLLAVGVGVLGGRSLAWLWDAVGGPAALRARFPRG